MKAKKRMTAARFKELLEGEIPLEEEEEEFEQLLDWKRRSDAAKRAVRTKRERYSSWPTRKGDHHRGN